MELQLPNKENRKSHSVQKHKEQSEIPVEYVTRFEIRGEFVNDEDNQFVSLVKFHTQDEAENFMKVRSLDYIKKYTIEAVRIVSE